MRATDRLQYEKREGKISYKHNNIKLTNLEGVISEMSKIAVTSLGGPQFSSLWYGLGWERKKKKTELTQFLSYSMFFINVYSLPSKSRSLQVSILGGAELIPVSSWLFSCLRSFAWTVSLLENFYPALSGFWTVV